MMTVSFVYQSCRSSHEVPNPKDILPEKEKEKDININMEGEHSSSDIHDDDIVDEHQPEADSASTQRVYTWHDSYVVGHQIAPCGICACGKHGTVNKLHGMCVCIILFLSYGYLFTNIITRSVNSDVCMMVLTFQYLYSHLILCVIYYVASNIDILYYCILAAHNNIVNNNNIMVFLC